MYTRTFISLNMGLLARLKYHLSSISTFLFLFNMRLKLKAKESLLALTESKAALESKIYTQICTCEGLEIY